jgi:hypothetical protein
VALASALRRAVSVSSATAAQALRRGWTSPAVRTVLLNSAVCSASSAGRASASTATRRRKGKSAASRALCTARVRGLWTAASTAATVSGETNSGWARSTAAKSAFGACPVAASASACAEARQKPSASSSSTWSEAMARPL